MAARNPLIRVLQAAARTSPVAATPLLLARLFFRRRGKKPRPRPRPRPTPTPTPTGLASEFTRLAERGRIEQARKRKVLRDLGVEQRDR